MKNLGIIFAVVLALASIAMAAVPGLTWTITKAPASYNANGTPIIAPSVNIYDVEVYTSDPTGSTMGAWAVNLISYGDANGMIWQLDRGGFPVDTEPDAIAYDAPSHPTNTSLKNNGYDKNADTWVGRNFSLIGVGTFTQPNDVFDPSAGPNEWDLHVGTGMGLDYGTVLLGQWAMNLSGPTSFLTIQGNISRAGVQYDLGTLRILVPEPMTLSLLGAGLLVLGRRRKA